MPKRFFFPLTHSSLDKWTWWSILRLQPSTPYQKYLPLNVVGLNVCIIKPNSTLSTERNVKRISLKRWNPGDFFKALKTLSKYPICSPLPLHFNDFIHIGTHRHVHAHKHTQGETQNSSCPHNKTEVSTFPVNIWQNSWIVIQRVWTLFQSILVQAYP